MSGNPKALLRKAESLLAESHKALKSDLDNPSLNEFENTVRELCEIVTKLPKEEARQYENSMISLSDSLSDLAGKLEKKRDEVKKQIEGLDYNKKAQIAYKVADRLVDQPKKTEGE